MLETVSRRAKLTASVPAGSNHQNPGAYYLWITQFSIGRTILLSNNCGVDIWAAASGNNLGAMTFDGGGTERGERLALGPGGDIFVTGSSDNWTGALTLKYDTSPPATAASPAGGTYDAAQTVTLTANEPATIYYTLDGSSPTTDSPVYGGPLTISATTTLKYFARDAFGHDEAVTSATYIILPTATISGTPASPTTAPDATFTIGGADVVAYKYRLDNGSYSAESPVATPVGLSGLGEGLHTMAVLGKDSAGNWQMTPTTVTWTVDLTPPVATVNVPPESAVNVVIAVGGTGVVAYRYRLDGGAYSAEMPVMTRIILYSLAEGPHAVEVIGRDSAGNWQTAPTTATWTVDGLPVSIPNVGNFPNILVAYSALVSDNIIQMKGVGITENLVFNRNVNVTLRGGYDPASGVATGTTTLYGSLEISSGTVDVENLVFMPQS